MTAAATPSTRWLLLILASAALLRLVPVWFGLPYLRARPDEEVAIATAFRVLDEDLNPHFFHWPSLTFYLFAALFAGARAAWRWLGAGEPAPAAYLVLARILVACAGTVTVFVLFRMSRRIAGWTTGLIAATLLAVAMLHVRDSHFAMTDVLATLFVTWSLALLLRGMDEADARKALRWFAAAGLAGGLAASTKYNAAAVLAAIATAQLLLFSRSWRTVARPASWLPSVAYGALFVAGFLLATPYAVLDFEAFYADILFDVTHLSGGHGVNLGRGWIYHLTTSLPYGLGITAFAAFIAGIVPFWRHHRREALVLGSFVGALYFLIGSGYTVFFRYILPIVPVACLVAAVGVAHLAGWLSRRTRLSYAAALAWLIVVTAGPGLVNAVWFDVLLARTDTRVLAARWLAPRLQPDHTLHDAGGDYARLDLADLRFHQWYTYEPLTRSFGHPEGQHPDWLVLYESPVTQYTRESSAVAPLASQEYVRVKTVRGPRSSSRAAVYDLQDAFFMPVWGFWTVERPGPTVHIYMRNDVR